MTIKELKKKIKNLPDDMQIIIQKDSEGNAYSPLADINSNAVYVPNSTWSGDIYCTDWTTEEACLPESYWKEIKYEPKALILIPVN